MMRGNVGIRYFRYIRGHIVNFLATIRTLLRSRTTIACRHRGLGSAAGTEV
jgi:hypothetical protein